MKRNITLVILMATILLGCSSQKDTSDDGAEKNISINHNQEELSKEKSTIPLPEALANLTPTPIPGDVTGKWKKVFENKNFKMPENALLYANHYIHNDEVHFLISINTNTTTVINDFGGFLSVRIHEYVLGEENDASILPSGMLYGEYFIDKKTGEIEQIN